MPDLWTDIIAPSRATTWEGAGVLGGIPTRTTIYQPPGLGTPGQLPTFVQNVTTAQIQAAIDACPTDQVVFLNAGTYPNIVGLSLLRTSATNLPYGNGITLRGAGAHRTRLIFTSGIGINMPNSVGVGVWSGEQNDGNETFGGPRHIGSWTAGYAQGTTVITLTGDLAGLKVGGLLFLDQVDDTTDWPSAPGAIFGEAPPLAYEGGNNYARQGPPGRANVQVVTVVAINGNSITIDPPIKLPNYRAGQSPGFFSGNFTVKGVGIEDMTLDFINSGNSDGIVFHNALNCWVKGVRSLTPGGNRKNIRFTNAARITVRDSYFYGPDQPTTETYGIVPETTSDLRFENNILHKIASPLTPNDPDNGSVYAYNYSVGDLFAPTVTLHGSCDVLCLFEGNDFTGFVGDNFHGTHMFITTFRNLWRGGGPNPGDTWMAQRLNRFFNAIGDVLGGSGPYETDLGHSGGNIFSFGWNADKGAGFPTDPNVRTTTMRWGCYDTVTGTVRFLAGENPSGLANFPSLASPLQVFPPSFYLASQPSWWGVVGQAAIPWPPIGPEVTGGTVAGYGGHANKIPARVNFETLVDDPVYPSSSPRIKIFDGSVYVGGAPPPPPPPPPTPSVPTRPFVTG